MYLFKEIKNLSKMFENRNISQRNAANEIGISEETFSRILNRKQKASKLMAYSVTKFFDNSAEIEDYFDCV